MQIEIGEGIKSVLIVEDEMIVAMLIEDLVRSLGVQEVEICIDAKSAIEYLAGNHVDCAVLDLWVRDGSTMSVADALTDKGVPFFFSSGSDPGALEERHLAHPMIGKPFHDDDFKLIFLDTWTLGRQKQPMEAHASPRVATLGATD